MNGRWFLLLRLRIARLVAIDKTRAQSLRHERDVLLRDVQRCAARRIDLVEALGLTEDVHLLACAEHHLRGALARVQHAARADVRTILVDRADGCAGRDVNKCLVHVAEAIARGHDLVPAELLAEHHDAITGVQFRDGVPVDACAAADVDVHARDFAFPGKGRIVVAVLSRRAPRQQRAHQHYRRGEDLC